MQRELSRVLVLTLPIGNARKMSQCIADYCAEEQLSETIQVEMREGNLQVPALKKLTFGPRLPATLVVQLKRFGNQQAAQKKINAVVEFDKANKLERDWAPLIDLQSVIYHTGQSLHAGHYTCAVRANKRGLREQHKCSGQRAKIAQCDK